MTTYNASEIDRLVREGQEDEAVMEPNWRASPHGEGNPSWFVSMNPGYTMMDLPQRRAEAIARTRNNLPATVAALSAAKAEVDRLTDEAAERKETSVPVEAFAKLEADRDHLAAEVERLTKERDEAREEHAASIFDRSELKRAYDYAIEENLDFNIRVSHEINGLRTERDRLSARVREMELTEEDREALAMLRSTIEIEGRYGSKVNRALALLDRLVKGGR